MSGLQFTRPIEDNRLLRAEAGPTLPASGFEAAGAVFRTPLTAGRLRTVAAIKRAGRGPLLGARQRDSGRFIPAVDGEIPPGVLDPSQPFDLEFGEFTGRVFSAEQLNERYQGLGLHFDRPMAAAAAEIMAESKRAEIIRNNIISRGPSGALAFTVQAATALLASAFDPIELASVFVPVVGQARAAGIIARLGRVRGRAAIGSIEGGVGNLLLEPAFVGLTKQLQLDYEFTDSIANVALGAVLGGTIGGAIGGVGRITAATRRKQVRALVDDIAGLDASARDVEIEVGILRRTDIDTRKAAVKQLTKEIKAATKELNSLRKRGVPEGDDSRTTLAAKRTDLEARKATASKELRALQKEEKTAKAEAEPEAAAEAAEVDPKVAGDAFRAAIAQMAQGKSVDVSAIVDPAKLALAREVKDTAARVKALQKQEKAALKKAQKLEQGTSERQAASAEREQLARNRLEGQQELTALKQRAAALIAEDAARVADTEGRPSRDGLARPELQQEAAAVLKAADDSGLEDEVVADLRVEVARMKEAGELSDAEVRAVEILGELDEKITVTGRVLKALKACILRTR